MPKFKKAVLFLLVFALLIPCISFSAAAEAPTLSAEAALLMEADSGQVILERNADTRLPMASTTKIMTALVALELASPETAIAVSPAAVGVEGSSVYLTEGEVLTLGELLFALLLESANDAATAIAIGLAGSVEGFAEEMNRTATTLGLKDTHFTNPHGLDDEEHYTTARELAILTRAALKNPLLRQIVATRKTTIPHVGIESVRLLINHNKLLRRYDGCIGVKTGFTKRSGRCLVSAAEREGVRLIAVTLNAPDDWNDHTKLLDHGFSLYKRETLCAAGEYTLALPVVNATAKAIPVRNASALAVTLPREHPPVSTTVELPRFTYAPLYEGECLGRVVFRCDLDGDGKAEIIGEAPLTVENDLPRKKMRRSFWAWLRSLFGRKNNKESST